MILFGFYRIIIKLEVVLTYVNQFGSAQINWKNLTSGRNSTYEKSRKNQLVCACGCWRCFRLIRFICFIRLIRFIVPRIPKTRKVSEGCTLPTFQASNIRNLGWMFDISAGRSASQTDVRNLGWTFGIWDYLGRTFGISEGRSESQPEAMKTNNCLWISCWSEIDLLAMNIHIPESKVSNIVENLPKNDKTFF